MAKRNWFATLVDAINHEYERRIRSASEVTEYGVGHGDHAHAPAEDEEVAEIINVPRGTRLGASLRSQPTPETPQETH